MPFQRIKYETDDGVIAQIRLDNDKVTLAGSAPAGAITQSNWLVSANAPARTQNKLTARAWIYQYQEVTAGNLTATRSLVLPKVTPTAYAAAPTATVTYKGTAFTFLRKRPEA